MHLRNLLRLRTIMLTLAILLAATGTAFASVNYTVKAGDSLYLIGKSYGLTAVEIKQANGLTDNTIYPGQQLTLPTSGQTYVVKAGDTLYTIGQRFGVSYQEIQQANGMSGTTIYVGQTLNLPTARAATTVSRGGAVPGSATRSQDLDLLGHLVYGEARGEPYTGKVAVAAVVLNRVKSPSFPNTVKEVIYQPGAFESVYDGQFNLQPDSTAYQAASDALSGWDPTGGALYFWNPVGATNKWVWSRTITLTIGNHVFAR